MMEDAGKNHTNGNAHSWKIAIYSASKLSSCSSSDANKSVGEIALVFLVFTIISRCFQVTRPTLPLMPKYRKYPVCLQEVNTKFQAIKSKLKPSKEGFLIAIKTKKMLHIV
jgi:hypothetical protein